MQYRGNHTRHPSPRDSVHENHYTHLLTLYLNKTTNPTFKYSVRVSGGASGWVVLETRQYNQETLILLFPHYQILEEQTWPPSLRII